MKLLRPLDIPVIAFAAALVLFSALAAYGKSAGTPQVTIRGPGGAAWVFPLDAEETVSVPGPLGSTVVEIHGGRARVLSSPCENRSCVAAGYLRGAGGWTACLPNQVFVMVESAPHGGETDAFAW